MKDTIQIEFTKKSFAVLVLENVFIDFNKPWAGGVICEDVKINKSLSVNLILTEQNAFRLIQNLDRLIDYVNVGYQNNFKRKVEEIKIKLEELKEVA